MKKIIMAIITIYSICAMVQAQDVVVNPSQVATTIDLSGNFSLLVTVLNNDTDIYDDITFHSDYLQVYLPIGEHLEPGIGTNFTLILGVTGYNATISDIEKGHIMLEDRITINGTNETKIITLAEIPLSINMTLPELKIPLKEFFYKKCFIEEDQEYCTEFNTSEIQNITIVNETYLNVTYNVLMPFETTKDFIDKYAEIMNDAARSMHQSKDAIIASANASIEAEKEKRTMFENAFRLLSIMESDTIPLWIEMSPRNDLLNISNMNYNEFSDALNMLFVEKKISQKTEKEMQSIPIPNGVMTREIEKIFIASASRVKSQTDTESTNTSMMLALSITMLVLGMAIFRELFWKRRVKKL